MIHSSRSQVLHWMMITVSGNHARFLSIHCRVVRRMRALELADSASVCSTACTESARHRAQLTRQFAGCGLRPM